MKKVLLLLIAIMTLLLCMAGCSKTKTLHCDNCNKEVTVDADSNMEEEWLVYCDECNEKLFGDDPLLGNN